MLALQKANVRYGGDNCDEDLSVLEELNYLRSPLTFTHLLGNRIGYVDNNKSCVWSSNPDDCQTPAGLHYSAAEDNYSRFDGTHQTAICSDYVMTSGRHYAKFYIDTSSSQCMFRFVYSRVGIMRPVDSDLKEVGWTEFHPIYDTALNDFLDEKTDAWGKSNVHTCIYSDFEGDCEWSDWDTNLCEEIKWDGMEGFTCQQDGKVGQVGLLLDLDEGTLTVYKDGKRLGIMMRGLAGEYCWTVSILAQAHGCPHKQNVRVERAPVPTTDTDQTHRPYKHEECECGSDSDESVCSYCDKPKHGHESCHCDSCDGGYY